MTGGPSVHMCVILRKESRISSTKIQTDRTLVNIKYISVFHHLDNMGCILAQLQFQNPLSMCGKTMFDRIKNVEIRK